MGCCSRCCVRFASRFSHWYAPRPRQCLVPASHDATLARPRRGREFRNLRAVAHVPSPSSSPSTAACRESVSCGGISTTGIAYRSPLFLIASLDIRARPRPSHEGSKRALRRHEIPRVSGKARRGSTLSGRGRATNRSLFQYPHDHSKRT